mmetsp:Transcript_26587/g.76793  ORF Transcript_26587/g.76793 Transcript_26587/m.76793 type:complete len:329 (-) Transcript_26587:112-1098(-)
MPPAAPFKADPARHCPGASTDIVCGEEHVSQDDDMHEHGNYIFHMTLPDVSRRLDFSSRDPSCGVLVEGEDAAEKTVDGRVDPFLFEPDYYLEAKTGFQVWPGSRLLVEALTCPKAYANCPKMLEWQRRLTEGANVVELGGGIGVVGTCLAAAGGNVAITDLATLVNNAVIPNIVRNSEASIANVTEDECCPQWMRDASTAKDSEPCKIGRGWAGGAIIDWMIPLDSQLSREVISNIDVVVGSDCFWMKKLIEPVLSVVADVFASSERHPKFLATYQRREASPALFSTVDEVLGAVRSRGWTFECHTWRSKEIEEDGDNEVFLFEISP